MGKLILVLALELFFLSPIQEFKYHLPVGWNESPPAHCKSPEPWSILDYSVKTQGEGRREEGGWENGGGDTGGRRREETERKEERRKEGRKKK